MTELEAIRERDNTDKDHREYLLIWDDRKPEEQALVDRHALLAKIDADAKLLAQGRKMFGTIFQMRYVTFCPYCGEDVPIGGGNEHKEYCKLNEWIKAVADE